MSRAVNTEKHSENKKKAPRGKPFEKGHEYAFKPGQSGNPGGQKKGVVYLSEAYKRLMTFTLEDLEAYKPANMTEEMAKAQLMRALNARDKEAINATEKIADRVEGRAISRQEIENIDPSDRERIERAIDTWMQTARENIDQLHADGKISSKQHQAEIESITRETAIKFLAVESPEVKNLIN